MNGTVKTPATEIKEINPDVLLSIIHEMNLALILHDSSQEVVFLNNTAKKMLDGSLAETFGMKPKDFGEAEIPELSKALIDTLEKGIKSPSHKFPFQTGSGKYRYLKAFCVPIKDDHGRVTHAAMLFQDITHRQQLEKEAIMAAKLSSIADMAYNLAHEINNPLTGIKLGLNALFKALEKYENIRILKSVLKDLDRIQGIVSSFLKARKPTFRPKRTRLKIFADILRDVEFHLSGRLVEKEIAIKNCTWDDDIYVFIDRDGVYQLFLNSLLNAIQAITSLGTITVRKRIVAYSLKEGGNNSMLCISFTDNGAGLDPLQQKQVFERFQSSRPGGSGLGLSICKDIITAHNGKMDFRSEISKGTTVEYYFPVTYG